ncbi:unnamed protein product, partial [Meganyctiphanes norvegica]
QGTFTMGVLSKLTDGIQAYNGCLVAQPLATKMCTSAVSSLLGDLLGQIINGQRINSVSLAKYALYGFVITGPLTHNFYKYLDRLVPPGPSVAVLKRMLIDRLLFAPFFLLVTLYVLARLEGKSHRDTAKEVKLKYWMVLVTNWKVWTPFQYININYIPAQYRSLFANLVAIGWMVYLANKRRQATTKNQ